MSSSLSSRIVTLADEKDRGGDVISSISLCRNYGRLLSPSAAVALVFMANDASAVPWGRV